jgi:hypothetical protein
MPSKTPRITGLLFNCAMNCALPRLLENINALVELERSGDLPSSDDAVYANYERLKVVFMTYYGINPNPSCSWEIFSTFLDTHSFYAQEIMFAPVFRIFIAEMALLSGKYETTDLEKIRDLQSPNAEADEIYAAIGEVNPAIGRYNNLEISTVSELFYAPLAIGNIKLYEHELSTNTYVEQATGATPCRSMPSWIQQDRDEFAMYLRGAHYELLPHHELEEPNARFIKEIAELNPSLTRVHDTLSSSQSAEQSSQGLSLLVIYVHDALEAWMNQAVASNQRQSGDIDYDTYKRLTADYHSDTAVGRETFAAILLAIAARTPCFKQQAEHLLEPDMLSPELVRLILNPDSDLATTFEAIQTHTQGLIAATGLARHGVFNVPNKQKFEAACKQMITVLEHLKKERKITQTEYDAMRHQIKILDRNPENHQQFLENMQQHEQLAGGKFFAYCTLAAGYAAKLCTLGYLGDAWIARANKKLEQITTLETVASEAASLSSQP